MDTINKLSTIIASVILSVGIVVAFGGQDLGVGGVPGVSLYPTSVTQFTQGGGEYATSTAASATTLTGSSIAVANYIKLTPTGANHTLTLPASTTFPGIPNAGDMRTFVVENAATAATSTTLAAGTGIDLQEPDGQNVVIGQNNYAVLTAIRQSNSDIVVIVDEVIPAD